MRIAMSQPPQAFFFQTQGFNSDANRYNGKIIIASLALLCFVVLFILALHIYAKWFWRRSQRRQAALWLRRQPLRFPGQQAVSVGLDRAIIDSLPTFIYKLSQKGAMECAVCLSELQENDEGRLLPKCNHSFHSECIDMWFLSHTTCPLCRASADPAESQVSSDGASQVSSDGASDELEMGDADVEAATVALRPAIVDDAAGAPSFHRPRAEGANAEALPSFGWRWRRSTSDRFLQNAPSGVQFPTNVLFWGNNAHVSSHTNPPQMPGQPPCLEHGQRGARSLPHMALDIPRTVQTLMGARCASTGADDASPSTHAAEGSSQQQSKAPGAGLSVFKRLLSRERKVFPTEQEMGVRGHAGMSSGAAAPGS